MDAKLEVQRQMVEAEEVSGDGLTWTFRLRPGLKFHDGEPVLARDAVTSINRWAARDTLGLVGSPQCPRPAWSSDRSRLLRAASVHGNITGKDGPVGLALHTPTGEFYSVKEPSFANDRLRPVLGNKDGEHNIAPPMTV